MGAANALSKGIIKGAKELFKKKPKVADAYKGRGRGKPKKEKTAAEALGKGQRPTPKQVEQSNLPNKPKVKAKVRSQAARAGGKARQQGIGKKDIESGKFSDGTVAGRAKTAAKNVKTRAKRNPGTTTAAATTGVVGTAALLQDKPKVTQASPKRLEDIKMKSPKPKKAAPKPAPKKVTSSAKNKESYDAMAERLAERRKQREEEKNAVRDDSGNVIRSGDNSIVRTRDYSKMSKEEIENIGGNFYRKGGAVKKPKGYMCGGHAKKKMASGGAVKKSAPKGCGCAKRGYGKAMK